MLEEQILNKDNLSLPHTMMMSRSQIQYMFVLNMIQLNIGYVFAAATFQRQCIVELLVKVSIADSCSEPPVSC